MNIASRMYWQLAAVVLLATVLLGLISASQSFEEKVDAYSRTAVAALSARPELTFLLYTRDSSALRSFQRILLTTTGSETSAVWDAGGEPLAEPSYSGSDPAVIPGFFALRGDAAIADATVVLADSTGGVREIGFWSALTDADSSFYVTVPMFSSLDPTRSGLTREDFRRSYAGAAQNASRVVIGYVSLGSPAAGWARSALFSAWPILTALLIPLLGLFFIGFGLRRRLAAAMEELHNFSQQIGVDGVSATLDVQAGGELRDVFDALNQLVLRLRRREQEVEAAQKMLSRKADESASTLSLREQELKQAAEEISAAKDRLHRASYYDSLTSLPNRVLFNEHFRKLLSVRERDGRYLALVLVNLNNFRRINESLGHSIGDQLLALVAQRLIECVRASDVLASRPDPAATDPGVARIGGDEFALVLNMLEKPEAAGPVAQRVMEALAEPCSIDGQDISLTASIGISIAPKDGDSVEDLLRAAAAAMQHGRTSRSSGFVYYNRDMDTAGVDQFRLEIELRRAIERNQLRLHYQPQVDTFDGSIVGAEALLRWEHPEIGLVPPYQFIPVAEELGMMRELGDWVLMEACRQLQAFSAQGLELPRIAVNVSAMEVSHDFVQRVWGVLETHGLKPSRLELGLSEGVLDDANPQLASNVRALGDMGVYLSLDNFGTAGVPLACLGHFALDEIKLDRRFVSQCDKPGDNGKLAKAIVAMADSLKMRPLAEGVETPGEYRFLSAIGVRAMQGYLFSKPVTAEELQVQLGVPWYYSSQIQRMALSQ